MYKFEKTKELTIDQLKTDVYHKHWEDQSWHEVLRLICGMIDEKWAGDIIEYLATKSYQPWPSRFEEKLPWNIPLALKCMIEVRNLGMIMGVSEKLLSMIGNLFDHLALSQERALGKFISAEIVPDVEIIGTNWPQREILVSWLHKHISRFEQIPAWLVVSPRSLGRFVGSIGKDMQEVRQVLTDNQQDLNVRIISLSALASGWHDEPRTFTILRVRALNDENVVIRREGISVLETYFYDDPRTSEVLQSCVLNEPNELVRGIARNALAHHFPEVFASRALESREGRL